MRLRSASEKRREKDEGFTLANQSVDVTNRGLVQANQRVEVTDGCLTPASQRADVIIRAELKSTFFLELGKEELCSST